MSTSPEPKTEFRTESRTDSHDFEPPVGQQKSAKMARIVESVRLGLIVLGLLAALTIMGTAGDALAVYNTTHVGNDLADFLLPLWPGEFNARPSVALVTCASIIFVTSAVLLAVTKVPAIRNRAMLHSLLSFIAPTISLIAGLVATSFFYGVNSSKTVFTLHSWSCQWSSVDMDVKPHWNTLCKESKAALYLMVMMIPLQVLILATVAVTAFGQKKQFVVREKSSPGRGSPVSS